jgi:hypothetical protein
MLYHIASYLYFRIIYWEGPKKCRSIAMEWDTLACGDVNFFCRNINIIEKNEESMLDTSKEISLEAKAEKMSVHNVLSPVYRKNQ